jgi:TonB family protein
MKTLLPLSILLLILLFSCSFVFAQSGRKVVEGTTVATDSPAAPVLISGPGSSVRRNETPLEYRCGKDGKHWRILENEVESDDVFSAKMVDTRVIFRSKPKPGYTLEARRNRKQGFVILKLTLSANGNTSRIRVLRGLPFGLTESAIKAACKLEFNPATKNGQTVSQWVTAEYVFRLPDSRLFRP